MNKNLTNKTAPESSGKIFVICGPSGSGKGTVVKGVRKILPRVERLKTYTTRPRGHKEKSLGRHFVSASQFEKMRKAREFFETNLFDGRWYGTRKHDLDRSHRASVDQITEVDLTGAKAIRKVYPNAVIIFLSSKITDLRRRLQKRGRDNATNLRERLKVAKKELQEAKICDYVVENKENEQKATIARVAKIISQENEK